VHGFGDVTHCSFLHEIDGMARTLNERRASGDYLPRNGRRIDPWVGSDHERCDSAGARRRPLTGVAPAPAPQPDGPLERGPGVGPPPELRGDGAVEAEPRVAAAS